MPYPPTKRNILRVKHDSNELQDSEDDGACSEEVQMSPTSTFIAAKGVGSFVTIVQRNDNIESSCDPTPYNPHYRADIDGIRCVAVIAVVIFHAWPQSFPGGFIGVDMFFVISGYIISTITLKQLHNAKTYSYQDFYSKRIRRIFPSLIVVVFVTIALSGFIMFPDELEAMMRTSISGSLFTANLQIMSLKGGYFDVNVKENPLLHLWSLGVEEQFYIVWPCCAAIVARKGAGPYIYTLIFLVSFSLNVYLVYHGYAKTAFYFPLSRFWQMVTGCCLAHYEYFKYLNVQCDTNSHVTLKSTSLSLIGMMMIGTGFLFINEESLFPGLWATLPTFGVATIIYSGMSSWLNFHVLGSRVFIFIGKISYPLYLWHWPLLVISRLMYKVKSDALLAQPGSMVMLALLCSVLTYYIVEIRVRYMKSRHVPVVLALFLAAVNVVGFMWLLIARAKQNAMQLSNENISLAPPAMKGEVMCDYHTQVLVNCTHMNSSRHTKVQNTTVNLIQAAILELPSSIPPGFEETVQSPLGRPYYVFNRGHNTSLLILGDSHAKLLMHRVSYLFNEHVSIHNNNTALFPTVYAHAEDGCPTLRCAGGARWVLEFNIMVIENMIPDNIVIMHNWDQWVHPGGKVDDPLHSVDEIKCCTWPKEGDRRGSDECKYQSQADVDWMLSDLRENIKYFKGLGVKNVYIVTMNPQV